MQPLVPACPNLPPRRPESAPCLGPLTRQAAGSAATGPCGERGGEGSRGTEVQRWSRAGDSLVDLVAPGSWRDGAGVGGGAVLGCGQPDCAPLCLPLSLVRWQGWLALVGDQHPAPLAHPSSSLTEPRPALIIWFPALGHQASRGRAPALAWVVQEGVPEAPGEGMLGARGSPWQRSQRRQCVFSRRCAAHAGNVGHRTPPWAVQAPCGTQGWASRRAEGPCPGDAVEGPE